MRSEDEMYDLILGIAQADARIRAVILNGSRANPNAPRDRFQDFDIVYLVSEMAPFRDDPTWIDRFGERMILQTPDRMGEARPRPDGGFTYLMQFMDGNRIDLTLLPLDRRAELPNDSLSVLLLDKDGRLGPFPAPSERDYLPRPPTPRQFFDCCNEFWWVSPYIAKGLWRRQIIYAHALLEQTLRTQLLHMLEWYVGIQTHFTVNPGKYGSHLQEYLAPELWTSLLGTYCPADYEATWQALFRMGDLFRRVAKPVAEHFGYAYPDEEDQRVCAFLRSIQRL